MCNIHQKIAMPHNLGYLTFITVDLGFGDAGKGSIVDHLARVC